MASDQIWETVIQQTESELLLAEEKDCTPIESIGASSHISSVVPQFMSSHDIIVFIEILAQSHKCDSQSISYYYEPIISEDGCLSLDELLLVFSVKSLIDGEVINRIIHRMRTIVPQEVQQRARAMLEKEKNGTHILTGPTGITRPVAEASSNFASSNKIQQPPNVKAGSKRRTKKIPVIAQAAAFLPEPPKDAAIAEAAANGVSLDAVVASPKRTSKGRSRTRAVMVAASESKNI